MTETSNTKRGWRIARRIVVVLTVLVTLVALFYAEEDWRGKRAWEKCKAELEAKGAVLDWSPYVPPPVPDDQNFLKAPGINESDWMGRGSRDLEKHLTPVALSRQNTNPLVVAELTIVPTGKSANANGGDNILRLDDPDARTKGEQLIRGALGPSLTAARQFALIARPLDQIKPAKAIVISDKVPATKDLLALFPETIESSHLKIEPVSSNSFRVCLNPAPVVASDYIQATDPFETDFDVIRAALKRPYVRFDGDYSEPATIPIPNFITLRALVQTLADRTKCHLLVGQPDKALRDLTLLEDICRVTEAKPTGKPMTLVASMINVAITGAYADAIADGFRLHAWREPQLLAIQEQLARVNLPPLVDESFHEERVFAAHTMEYMSRPELAKLFTDDKLSKHPTDPRYLLIRLAPRGWFYQNMVVHTEAMEPILDMFDSTNDLILPGKAAAALQYVKKVKMSPYTFLNLAFLPNFTRAWQTVAHNQTLANEALVACALEGYRLAHGEYPATLEALVPQFAEKLPQDIIGGQPLKYRRTDGEHFLLYSIAWNEQDDDGQTALKKDGKEDRDSGDWVWQSAAR